MSTQLTLATVLTTSGEYTAEYGLNGVNIVADTSGYVAVPVAVNNIVVFEEIPTCALNTFITEFGSTVLANVGTDNTLLAGTELDTFTFPVLVSTSETVNTLSGYVLNEYAGTPTVYYTLSSHFNPCNISLDNVYIPSQVNPGGETFTGLLNTYASNVANISGFDQVNLTNLVSVAKAANKWDSSNNCLSLSVGDSLTFLFDFEVYPLAKYTVSGTDNADPYDSTTFYDLSGITSYEFNFANSGPIPAVDASHSVKYALNFIATI